MKTQKLKLSSFARLSSSSLATQAASILQLMQGNPHFPAPIPNLSELETALNNFNVALIDSLSCDRLKIAVKNRARKELEPILVQLARYVMYVANGDTSVMAGSGFELTKQRETNALAQPGVITISNGISTGQLVVKLPRVKGAYSYMYQITPDPYTQQSIWKTKPVLTCSNTFENLVSGQKYWIRVGAVGSGTQLAFSQVASRVAQ